jgi:RNA polymerase sigma factor (TIGR02999 family)
MPEPKKAPEKELDDLVSLVYEELRRIASSLRKLDQQAMASATTLVHEAWLKLRKSPDLASTSPLHFKSIAARAMRQVLVNEARRRNAQKRGGAGRAIFVKFADAPDEISCDADLLALDAALEQLASLSPRQAQMVESRFFGGLNVAETAALLGVSESSIERDWRAAKAWLASRIRRKDEKKKE